MGNKNSTSRRQSKVLADNQGGKSQEGPPSALPNNERQTSKNTKENARHEELSAKTETSPVGLARDFEQQQGAVDCPINKGSLNNVDRLPPRKEQHEIKQGVHQTRNAASEAVAGVGSISTRNSSSRSSGRNDHNVPLPTSANATDGYISFSESDSEISAPPRVAATTAATALQQRSSEGDTPQNDRHEELAAGVRQGESQQDRPTGKGGAESGGGDDMWDFGDEDSEDEQACGGRVVETVNGGDTKNHNASSGQHQQRLLNRSSDGNEGALETPAPGIGGAVGGGGNDINVDEPQQARVVVDRLGRRENAPMR